MNQNTLRQFALLVACLCGTLATTNCDAQSDPTMMPTDKAIALFESRIAKMGNDYASRTILGRLHLRRAGENDEFSDYLVAEKQLRAALKIKPDYVAAETYLATALLAQHRFAEAAEIAQDILTSRPNATMALATLADAQLERGRWDAASKTLRQLAALNQSPPVLVRQARLAELRGEHDQAMTLLERAVEDQEQLSASDSGWYKWRVGRLCLDSGKLDDAARWFEAARHHDAQDAHAIAGIAAVEAARGNLTEAAERYREAIDLAPSPPLMAALGDVYKLNGEDEQAQSLWDQAESIILAEGGEDSSRIAHAREAALFFANHDRKLELAVELARVDLKQRQDPESLDTLAWALHQAGNREEAQRWIDRALEASPDHAMIHYHAGMIAHSLGDPTAATTHLERALKINPHFSLRDAVVAGQVLRTLKTDAS